MVGAFDANTRVLVKALQVPGTVIGLCEDEGGNEYMSTPVYHVRLDTPIVYGGSMVDLIHAAETAITRLPPPLVSAVAGDVVKWLFERDHRGAVAVEGMVVVGKVTGTYTDEYGAHFFVTDTNGAYWELDANQGTIFVVKRETAGTEKLPI